ncbi:MAG: hypothetical protein KDK48_01780 [Chlamydiia bacterium]|nr:hypothetical protein [Chlamydiia bacterium]
MTEDVDLVRQLVELAVTSGRSHQSPQTSFVHWCHTRGDETVNHTIPLYENFLFCLALMRMRTQQNITEAKEILARLLAFQAEDGNYPVYLHEYPLCRDRYNGAQILVVHYWILKQFGAVLGKELKEKLHASAEALLERYREDKGPFHIAVKVAGSLIAFGRLLKKREMEERGNSLLESLREESFEENFGTWYSPTHSAEALVGLTMVYDQVSASPWSHFWETLTKLWFPKARCYAGPALKVLQSRFEPEPTLYDLFLGDFSGGYPYHAFFDHPFQLQGALVHDSVDKLALPEKPFEKTGILAGHQWLMHQEEEFAWTAMEAKGSVPPELKKGYHHFRLLWGDQNKIHSLSCQGGRISRFEFEKVEGGVDLVATFGEDPEFAGRDKAEELCFYVDRHEGFEIFVWDKKATTFEFGDVLTLKGPGLKARMQFELEEGDGRVQGHIMPSNRPAQTELKGENRFEAYDWKIALRTIRRSGPCKVRVRVRVP